MKTQYKQPQAFTLVELLVVIAIVSLLAAIITPAVYFATIKAKNAGTGLEIAAIEKALEAYKLEMGEYPPDFSELALYSNETDKANAAVEIINNHLQRTFRRRSVRDLPREDAQGNPHTAFLANLSPENALLFWLRGFSNDPQLPLFGVGERSPLFEFDKGRIKAVESGVAPAFSVAGVGTGNLFTGDTTSGFADITLASGYFPKGSNMPYVYYQANPIQGLVYPPGQRGAVPIGREGTAYLYALEWAANSAKPSWSAFASSSTPAPLPMTSSNVPISGTPLFGFAAAEKFHIYAAGIDSSFASLNPTIATVVSTSGVNAGAFGTNMSALPMFPKGAGYTDAHKDNITNFSGGNTLEDAKPE